MNQLSLSIGGSGAIVLTSTPTLVKEGAREPPDRRTFQPIWRRSYAEGSEYGTIWRPPTHDRWTILRAAERYDERGRKAGELDGPLGRLGIRVLKELLWRQHRTTGRLDPSYATIAAWIRRSVKGVWNALRKLREHGFLGWIRRYVAAEDDLAPAGARRTGSPVRQTSNAYWVMLPRAAAWLLGPKGARPPAPDDERSRREAVRTQMEAAVRDEAADTFDSPAMRRALAKANAASPGKACDFP